MISNVIFLAIVGYGVFLGLQYVPQKIENMSIDSILASVKSIQEQAPSRNVRDVEKTLDQLLNTSELSHLKNNFKVYEDGDGINVTVSREWVLNMIYQEKKITYERKVALK